MPLLDPDLIAQYREMTAQGTFPGRSIVPYAGEVARIIRKTGAETLLDYGCGCGLQYSEDRVQDAFGIMPRLYDPGVERFDRRPRGKFDGVLFSDVAEHVPESDLPEVLADVFGFARVFVFMSVCCRAASKHMRDGRNAHVTVRPEGWWEERVAPFRRKGLLTRLVFTR